MIFSTCTVGFFLPHFFKWILDRLFCIFWGNRCSCCEGMMLCTKMACHEKPTCDADISCPRGYKGDTITLVDNEYSPPPQKSKTKKWCESFSERALTVFWLFTFVSETLLMYSRFRISNSIFYISNKSLFSALINEKQFSAVVIERQFCALVIEKLFSALVIERLFSELVIKNNFPAMVIYVWFSALVKCVS